MKFDRFIGYRSFIFEIDFRDVSRTSLAFSPKIAHLEVSAAVTSRGTITTAEMVVPAMKKLTDYVHSKGMYCDLHSCGHIELQVPNMIAAGWDSWSPMPMNDTMMLHEKYGDKLVRVDNANSSVKSKAKIFCVCEEYEFLDVFLESKPTLQKKLEYLIPALKSENYRWNYERLAPQYQYEFLMQGI